MPRYEVSVVTYLDILGFRKLIEGKDADEIYKILSSLKLISAPADLAAGGGAKFLKYTFNVFSDLAVRSVRVADNDLDWLLNWELSALAYVQRELLNEGVIVRGAATVGQISCDRKFVFGPALVRAYELEESIAVFPRIVFDPAIAARFGREKEQERDDNPFAWNAALCHDFDGVLFVDYLRFPVDLGDFTFLRTHKNAIVSGAKEFCTKDSAAQKYVWLANYHNRVVESVPEELLVNDGLLRDELAIKRAELQFKDSTIARKRR
jgi:hypothetical protein